MEAELNQSGIMIPSPYKSVQFQDAGRGIGYEVVVHDPPTDFEQWHISSSAPSINALLAADLLGGQGLFVDVGANIGLISIPVAKTGPKVICVEPNPENILMLTLAAKRNGLAGFEINQGASSSSDGVLRFAGAEAWGHISESDQAYPVTALRLDTLLTRPDALFGGDGAQPIVLKVDVEGHEAAVLEGATRVLKSLRPFVIIESIEIEGELHPGVVGNAKALLEEHDYRLYLIRNDVLSPTHSGEVQEGHVSDYLAVPAEITEFLEGTIWEIRQLTLDERVAWIQEMVEFPSHNHHRHALGVLARWQKESNPAFRQALPHLERLRAWDDMSDRIAEIDLLLEPSEA